MSGKASTFVDFEMGRHSPRWTFASAPASPRVVSIWHPALTTHVAAVFELVVTAPVYHTCVNPSRVRRACVASLALCRGGLFKLLNP